MKKMIIAATIVLLILPVLYLLLIGNFEKPKPEIVSIDHPLLLVGTEIKTDNKAIYKDVGVVASRFNEIKKKYPIPNLREPWASVNISRDYNPETGTFTYIVTDAVTKIDSLPPGLNAYEVPPLQYAVFRICPKSRIAWGITMGQMKRYIYTEWLPRSEYLPSDVFGEFELHDERSLGKHPEISLYVAIKDK